VAKLWPFLSVLLVFVMLLFLAPTLLLLPGQIVSAQGGEAVTEEIEATFSFSEAAGGSWHNFTAGSGGVQAPGPCLAQYTRDNVVRDNTTLAGCEFRNYTTSSVGTVASTVGDLNGTITLAWNTITFNETYPYTPKYNATDPYFGWMTGRGHFYDNLTTANNFTFVFVADFDCDDVTMTNADGKGFMLSVEENGRFANAIGQPDVPENMHRIIGDFEISKRGSTYTGSFHLRNYPPSEVYNLGELTVDGGVLQELSDDIAPGLNLVDFIHDGAVTTHTDYVTDFEEVAWGRDPIKNVTAGHLGKNGTMDLSRNNVLYLKQPVIGGIQWVYIQGLPICNLYINDTNAGVRLNDGSSYGELWELLLLNIPYQELVVVQENPNYFDQLGYTFTPFGMLHPSTECYAGTESFANAEIFIQACVGTALQHSTDLSYGLYPHPVVTSVSPNNGAAGQTMNVTINGKYFLRAAGQKSGWVPSAGSVNFSRDINVNNYTVINSTAIEANITINSVVCPGPRDVNVTSCFNYTAGHGAAPYESGLKAGAFNITGPTGTLEGHVTFAGRQSNNAKWIEPFVVKVFNGTNLLCTGDATTNTTGVFTINITPGTYDIAIKNWTCLSEKVAGVVLNVNATTVVNFGTTREGDAGGNDWITGADRDLLYTDWGKTVPPGTWQADFNRDGWLTGADRDMMYTYWGQKGALVP